jgi:hypothetical protein
MTLSQLIAECEVRGWTAAIELGHVDLTLQVPGYEARLTWSQKLGWREQDCSPLSKAEASQYIAYHTALAKDDVLPAGEEPAEDLFFLTNVGDDTAVLVTAERLAEDGEWFERVTRHAGAHITCRPARRSDIYTFHGYTGRIQIRQGYHGRYFYGAEDFLSTGDSSSPGAPAPVTE